VRPGGLEPPAFGSEVTPRIGPNLGSSCSTGVPATNPVALGQSNNAIPTSKAGHFPVHSSRTADLAKTCAKSISSFRRRFPDVAVPIDLRIRPGKRPSKGDLIHQILYTTLGERLNHPDFGCGLLRLIFSPISKDISGLIQSLVREGLTWAVLVGRRIYSPHAWPRNVLRLIAVRTFHYRCVPLPVPVRSAA